MSGAIEDIAKKWLAEPAYTKVFKHTADVIEDYLCYLLTAIGAIAGILITLLGSAGEAAAHAAVQVQGVRHWDFQFAGQRRGEAGCAPLVRAPRILPASLLPVPPAAQ